MPRYFMHLNECGTVVEDETGVECADIHAALARAAAAARDVMCAEIREGRLCLACRIVVTDEAQSEVATVHFRDAVAVSGLGERNTPKLDRD